MLEHMLDDAVSLLDLERDDREAELGKELEMASMHVTRPKWPLLDSFTF